jgi:hypothetical protein
LLLCPLLVILLKFELDFLLMLWLPWLNFKAQKYENYLRFGFTIFI